MDILNKYKSKGTPRALLDEPILYYMRRLVCKIELENKKREKLAWMESANMLEEF